MTTYKFQFMKTTGEQYYVNPHVSNSIPIMHFDWFNPIFMLIIGMTIAFTISYLVYYVRKHNVSIDRIMNTVYGLIGLSGIGLLVVGIIDVAFQGFAGVAFCFGGLGLIYAGGTMLADQQKLLKPNYISSKEEAK